MSPAPISGKPMVVVESFGEATFRLAGINPEETSEERSPGKDKDPGGWKNPVRDGAAPWVVFV